MKIAMISEHASPLATPGGEDAGGQNVHVAALACALARRGAAVTVYTRRDDPGLPRRAALAPNVVVEHVDAGPPCGVAKDHLLPFMDAFAGELERAWRRSAPDVVHAHFWMSGRAALAAARPLAVPVVQTFHALGVVKRRYQGDKDTSPPERIDEERAIIARAQRIIATCRDEVDELLELGASPRRTSIVPCGVDLRAFGERGDAEERPRDRRRIVVLGRLVERKGVADVLLALAGLPDAELVVAGGPPQRALKRDPEGRRLMALARRIGVASRVDFRGGIARADVPPLLRSADVAVCVPWYEPFGIVPLEAMACGVPVVASAVGGLLDTVVDGQTGLHVEPRSPGELVRALRTVLDDDALRARLGRAGAIRVRRSYGWDRIAEATLAAYRVTLERRPATTGGRRRAFAAASRSADGSVAWRAAHHAR